VIRSALALAAAALCSAHVAHADARIEVLERRPLAVAVEAQASPTHALAVTLAYFAEAWPVEVITPAVREAARILGQCGVVIAHAELARLRAPDPYRDFHTRESRILAGALRLPKPTVYFVADTRQRPAFDAEAIGQANSATRPELANTVWVTRSARDPGIVLAHELVHVLMDSGEHSTEPRNLMRQESAPNSVRLADAQCERLRKVATGNGLLRPLPSSSR